MKKPNVYVYGYFRHNVGDDLFVYVLSKRYPNVNFVLDIESQFDHAIKTLSNVTVNHDSRLKVLIRKLLILVPFIKRVDFFPKVDAIFEVGGSVFMQPIGTDKASGTRKVMARKSVPYFISGSNFGPFRSNEYLEANRALFRTLAGIVFRDKASVNLFSNLSNVDYAPDLVFNLSVDKNKCEPKAWKNIVITPIDVLNKMSMQEHVSDLEDCYVTGLTQFIEYQTAIGNHIQLFGFCPEERDMDAVRKIFSRLGARAAHDTEVIEYQDFKQVFEIFDRADYVISSRYHSMILGWLYQLPQFVLSYSSKTTNVISDIFPEQYRCDISNFRDYTINIEHFNTLDSQKLAQIREQSELQFRYFDKFINNN